MIFTDRGHDKYTFRKYAIGKTFWQVDWPRAEGREDWKRNLQTLAARCGHKIDLDKEAATITEPSGRVVQIKLYKRLGDWRTMFLEYIDAIQSGRVDAPPLDTVFPPVETRPVNPVLRDGFTVDQLDDWATDTHKDMLRVLRPVTYSELLRLDGTTSLIAKAGILHGHKTGLSLMECACGRIFVAYDGILDQGIRHWRTCGCLTTVDESGYTGNRRDTLRGAWREWCTMKLLDKTDCALHSLLQELNLPMTCNLPDKFEDFWYWYSYYAKRNKQLYVERVDTSKPFSIDNLTFDVPRWVIRDPANGRRCKVGI